MPPSRLRSLAVIALDSLLAVLSYALLITGGVIGTVLLLFVQVLIAV